MPETKNKAYVLTDATRLHQAVQKSAKNNAGCGLEPTVLERCCRCRIPPAAPKKKDWCLIHAKVQGHRLDFQGAKRPAIPNLSL